MNKFLNIVVNTLNEVTNTQEETLKIVCKEIALRIKNGGKFYVLGTGHSHMVGEEFYSRAGGLACVNMIAPLEFTLSEHPLKSTFVERISEYANVILKQYNLNSKDIIMICSNSGRNGLPIELSLQCKELNIPTIAFTSIQHSKEVSSRHKSNKNLYQICDYVIDNKGTAGDARITIEGVNGKMGSTSTIVGTYVAQIMGMMIAEELVKLNFEVPVFLSSNVDNGDNWNKNIMKKYYNV